MICHEEEEEDADRQNLIEIWVFKSTSENTTKRLKMYQKTREAPKITGTKVAISALKQFVG